MFTHFVGKLQSEAEEEYTYSTQVDLTNGGADDQTAVTVVSGLPSGITKIEGMYHSASTDAANQAICLRLGDAGGIEAAGYDSNVASGTSEENRTDGLFNSHDTGLDAANVIWGIWTLVRWDVSEHLWLCTSLHMETGAQLPKIGTGTKTLSGELTQLQVTTSGGTAQFDGGEVRVRYF